MPISRLGGVAIAVAFILIAMLVAGIFHAGNLPLARKWTVVSASLAMFGLGLWDDIKPLGAKYKLLIQILIASVVYFSGFYVDGLQIEKFKNPITHVEYSLGWIGYFATVAWLVVLTNLINLIDGIDGLAGGICLMLMGLVAYVSHFEAFTFLIAVGMAGALLGFLYYNFPPARIYLGDGGAYFLGFLIAIMTMSISNKGTVAAALIAPLFALALPIVDVSLAILRRGLKGLPIFRPDRHHIHHRLMATGFSKVKAVVLLYAVSLVFLAMAFLVFWSEARWLPLVFGLACLIFLGAAGSLSFSREWFAVGRVVGNSLEMRKQTRFALLLSNWMLLEAERCTEVGELWEDYRFTVRKLGFSCLTIELQDGKVYRDDFASEPDTSHRQSFRQEVAIGNIRALDLSFDGPLDHKSFDLLSELAAEIWVNSLQRWQVYHEAVVRLDPARASSTGLGQLPMLVPV